MSVSQKTVLRGILIALVGLTMAFVLAACAGNGEGMQEGENSAASDATQGSTDTEEGSKPADSAELNIQVAASLTDAMNEIIDNYTSSNPGVKITPNYDSSGTLAEQILQGAPADLFVSANQAKMDTVEEGGMVADGTRKDFVENELVMIVPKGNPKGLQVPEDIAGDNVEFVAVGEPEGVPVGKYTQQAFESLGITDKVSGKTVEGKDVRAVLTYVETGDADAGFVYMTDAMISDQVEVVTVVGGHDPVVYPAALLQDSSNPDAAQVFLDYLYSDEAASVLEEFGFKAIK